MLLSVMHYLVPFVMLFGYLSMRVEHGENFGVVMPLVMVLLAAWSLVVVVRNRSHATRTLAPTVGVLGLVALAIFARFSVVTYDALGPQVLGAPVTLAVVWAALMLGAGAIALRSTHSWAKGLLYVAVLAIMWSLVVDPAAFNIGIFAYHASGLYYGIPFTQALFWGCSAAVGVAAVWWSTGRKESSLPIGTLVGPLLVLAYATGVCIATGAWIPAVIGLVLAQLGLRAMYYL